jgi:hypothetical protein
MSASVWSDSDSQPGAYVERRSAVQWPLVLTTLSCWAIFVASVVLITVVSVDFATPLGISLLCSLFYAIILLGRAWPVGIQADANGIHIGGISDAQRDTSPSDAKRIKLPHARWQHGQVFACPWSGVQRVEVVTNRAELRKYAKLGRIKRSPSIVHLGILTVPFMRAALVVTVDLQIAEIPRFRAPDDRRYWFKTSDFTRGNPSPIWVVPTRHPEELRNALTQLNAPGLVLRHHHGDQS